MKISGATFIRNAIKHAYPIVESITSIIDICDEFIVNVGKSDDDTLKLILNIGNPKIKIIESIWPSALMGRGGVIFSQQTNIALEKCVGDWIFYLQGDEVVHEDDLERIVKSCKYYLNQKEIEGLIFDYLHFYGSYFTYQTGRNWYRREIRIIRNGIGIKSFRDAQGFRKDNRKLKVAHSGSRIFHYGWVRPQEAMLEKIRFANYIHHPSSEAEKRNKLIKDYFTDLGNLALYTGSHPKVIHDKISLNPLASILKLIEEYFSRRTFFQRMKDFSKTIMLGEYRGFKLIKNDFSSLKKKPLLKIKTFGL